MNTKAVVATTFFAMVAVACYSTASPWPLLALLGFGGIMSWFDR